jgi:hypothetical protein
MCHNFQDSNTSLFISSNTLQDLLDCSYQQNKSNAMASQFDQLKEHTIVVADTGDVDAIKRIQPQDATTNPSLIYKAAGMEQYAALIDDAVAYGKGDLGLAMVRAICNIFGRWFWSWIGF